VDTLQVSLSVLQDLHVLSHLNVMSNWSMGFPYEILQILKPVGIQVSKDSHSALEFQGPMLAEQLSQGKSPESCAGDLAVIHCETAADSTSRLAHQSAAEAKGQSPPASEAGDTGIKMYHALSRAGNILSTGLVAEPLVSSTAGMHRSQDTPGEQQACDRERTHMSGGPEQQHTTAEQSHCEDAREASLLPAEPLLAPAPGLDAETMTHSAGTASECHLEHGKVASSSGVAGDAGKIGTHEDFSLMTELAGAANKVQLDHGTIESSDGVGGAASTGEMEDIRSQVLHMMDERLPIAHAMQRAAEHVKSSESGSDAAPRWSHRGRKGKSSAHRYRWLRVGRTWKKHAV